jgi:hypothetical protein
VSALVVGDAVRGNLSAMNLARAGNWLVAVSVVAMVVLGLTGVYGWAGWMTTAAFVVGCILWSNSAS